MAYDASGIAIFGNAVFGNAGLVGASGQFSTRPPSGQTTATASGFTGGLFPTHGPTFGIIATGAVQSADDPNTSGATSGALGGGPRSAGGSDRDVTVLRIPFAAPTAANCLTMDFQFLSEEYPEWVGSAFNDAFIAELDATTWTTSGSSINAPDNFAFDAAGNVVSVNAVGLGGFSTANAAGTTYDGATKLLRASKQLSPGNHSLFLSIFDQGDQVLDSAAFVDNIRVGFVPNPAVNCVAGAQVANYSLELTPPTATLGIGSEHTVTARLVNDAGVPLANVPIAFERTGANPGISTVMTGADGAATMTYTGMRVGTDGISAAFDADSNGTAEALDSASAEWENRWTLDALPDVATRLTGQTHSVTATLANEAVAAGGRTVTFTVAGANPGAGSDVTAPDGTAVFSYTGANIGIDTITASFDLDGDGTAEASDVVQVEFVNTPPDCSPVSPSVSQLKQNNHAFTPITLSGATDADGDPVTIAITSVEQDEVLNGEGDGNTDIDARPTASSDTVEVRAERAGPGDGRVYLINFTASDGRGGECTGTVVVEVPHDSRGTSAVDSGARYNSFGA